MLRAINGSNLKDRISTASLLEKFNLRSVNQLAAQIKLVETWKSLNVPDYPIVLEPYNQENASSNAELRPRPTRIFNDSCRLQLAKSSFNVDAARLWNLAPEKIKTAKNIFAAKAAITEYVKNLPL